MLGWPKKTSPITLEQAEKIADELDTRTDCGEPVRFWWERKLSGGWRPIVAFGPRRRALQKLAVLILQTIWGPVKYDHAQRGLGRKVLMQKVSKAIEKKGGPRWFLTADVTDCFASFNRDKMTSLIPLPRAVIENCIFVMDDVQVIEMPTLHTATSEIAVRRGLPQGSLASFYLACKLLEPVLQKMKGRLVVSFADDILIATETKKVAEANKQALDDLLRDHPAGPLFMKSRVARLGKPIDFLSYRIRYRWHLYGGGVRLTPSPKAFDRFERKLVNRLTACSEPQFVTIARDYPAIWMNSHANWDRSQAGDQFVWMNVEQYLVPEARAARKKAGKSSPGYFPLPG